MRFGNTRYRVLYQRSDNLIVLLHAIEKDTGAVPRPGRRSGTLYTDCTGVGSTKALFAGAQVLCTVTYRFADGQIVAAGATTLGPRFRLAIVGRTGAYEAAGGSVASARPAKGFDSADVLRLAD